MTSEEKIFLNDSSARVTSARVIIGGQTFAMSGITSVEVRKIYPKTSYLPGLLATFFGLGTVATPENKALGVVLLAFGAWWIWSEVKKPIMFGLILRAAGGEIEAIQSEDATNMEVIAEAITDAMVFRG